MKRPWKGNEGAVAEAWRERSTNPRVERLRQLELRGEGRCDDLRRVLV